MADGSSTLTELLTEYGDNADYADGAGDVTKARAFAKVCRILLVKLPAEMQKGATRTRVESKIIQQELQRADRWLAANDPLQRSGQVRHPNFNYARS